ncbi:hypothetical protein TVAG_366290 [Trichomonas vaginalis G3]|uniref:Uncharacterized protein n=1 Tax=Trichomonas vaginalis (strain ATCC PRA-98 / G3) TaxID=412133 RepID=A2DHS3_TRIV3|nr:hypothetical protein TVAG_366290 [Trichomonas vaginalis G3]|eukprot:XP_001581107.1 hypothetical protein [Trichomonas vaginalis G3]
MDLLTSSKLTVNNENQVATVIMKMIEADKSYTGTLECIYREWLSENKLKELYEFVTKEKLYTKLLHFYRALEAMKNSRPIYFKAQYLRNVVIHKIKYNESIVNVAVISSNSPDDRSELMNGGYFPRTCLVGSNYIFIGAYKAANKSDLSTEYIQY